VRSLLFEATILSLKVWFVTVNEIDLILSDITVVQRICLIDHYQFEQISIFLRNYRKNKCDRLLSKFFIDIIFS